MSSCTEQSKLNRNNMTYSRTPSKVSAKLGKEEGEAQKNLLSICAILNNITEGLKRMDGGM